jgi:hypothetical protein
MATSRLARLFGRKDDREADTAPPAYTGIGAPRQYEPPPGAPGHGTAGYRPGPASPTAYVPARPGPPASSARPAAPAPSPAPSPYEHAPVVTRARYDEAARRRRAADQQVEVLERQDAKLTAQIHAATEQERHDYVRELVSRRIAVRSRLEESTLRRNRLQQTEDELGAGLAAYDAPSGRR